MKLQKTNLAVITILGILFSACSVKQQSKPSMKNALDDSFFIGTAMNLDQIEGNDSLAVQIIKHHFNSVVAENCMKSEQIQPKEGEFNFSMSDKFVDFGEQNNMYIIGHVLIWDSQVPQWFFVDGSGNNVTREVLIDRIRTHISTIVTRYKGRVHCWDVVNEAILDDGSLRKNKFYEIIGEDYIKLAFQFANEADPNAELLYNDYSMAHEGRRKGVINLVNNLQKEGIRIDGIGMQAHCQMDFPLIEEFEKSIIAFAKTGLDVHITEMDITILPSMGKIVGADVSLNIEYEKKINPYSEGLSNSARIALHNKYFDFFELFLKHSKKIKRVTIWGVSDKQSWRNYWPVKARTDYPLLFDRKYKAKPIVKAIIEAAELKKNL